MSETGGARIRVTLRWLQILDNLEPFYKEKGEFRFRSVVSSENRGGIQHGVRYSGFQRPSGNLE